jgi:hypothetical protein
MKKLFLALSLVSLFSLNVEAQENILKNINLNNSTKKVNLKIPFLRKIKIKTIIGMILKECNLQTHKKIKLANFTKEEFQNFQK